MSRKLNLRKHNHLLAASTRLLFSSSSMIFGLERHIKSLDVVVGNSCYTCECIFTSSTKRKKRDFCYMMLRILSHNHNYCYNKYVEIHLE